MSLVINTNLAASTAAMNLGANNAMLQKSLSRLSSGSKITTSSDDAGGLAVSMKLQAAIRRTDATRNNVSNAESYLQSQDGGLKVAGKILERIAELKTLGTDATKSSTDLANYNTEFTSLQAQLSNLTADLYNGVPLFGAGTVSVTTSEDGLQSMNMTQAGLVAGTLTVTGATGLSSISTAQISTCISNVATSRAQNGADASRLGFADEMLSTNRTNLESANSRIVDVDVALESTRLAKNNILVQAGSSMLAQANTSTQAALKLLQ